jgi:hypothetical protein
MRKHPTGRGYLATADHPTAGRAAAELAEQTAACETGRHAACRGEILSLLVPVGTACGCPCHQPPEGR